MKYWPPFGSGNANAGYENGNLELGIEGSIPPAQAIEAPQREIVNVLLAAGIVPDGNDNTQLLDVFGKLTLKVVPSPTFYIRTDGDDSNDGSANAANGAFRTITGALAGTQNIISTNGIIRFQLGVPGTYAAPNEIIRAGASYEIIGDISAPSSYIISGSGLPFVSIVTANGCKVALRGVTISNTGTTNPSVGSANGGAISVHYCTFVCVPGNPNAHVTAYGGSNATIGDGNVFVSSMGGWLLSRGSIDINSAVVTFSGTPAWSGAGVIANYGGQVIPVGSVSIVGNATGPRYSAALNGVIASNGNGANFYPGSVAGSVGTGGQYV